MAERNQRIWGSCHERPVTNNCRVGIDFNPCLLSLQLAHNVHNFSCNWAESIKKFLQRQGRLGRWAGPLDALAVGVVFIVMNIT